MVDVFDLSEVLKAEQSQLAARRNALNLLLDTDPPAGGSPRQEAHRLRPFGVCLSGGGIRSATFNLGILQGLAESGLLPLIDYLSTVSGGGYIGTWLHGVIKRKGNGDPGNIADLISPTKTDGSPREPGDANEDPVTFLRKYSNYLAPRLGLFSPDFWVIAIIWIRNILLNQLILAPFLAGVVLVGVHAGFLQQQSAVAGWQSGPAAGGLSIVLLAVAVWIIGENLREIINREFAGGPRKASIFENHRVIWICVGLVLVSALVIGTSSYDPIPDGLTNVGGQFRAAWYRIPLLFLVLWGLFFVLQGLGGFIECFNNQHPKHSEIGWLHLIWIPVTCSAATTVLLSKVLHWITTWQGDAASVWHTIAWAPPLVVLALMAGVTLQIGLMGADFPDSTREWLSRLGALLTLCCTAWMGLFAIGVFGPKWFSWLALNYGKTAASLLGGWIATTAAGVVAGRSPSTGTAAGDPNKSNMALEWIGKIAPTVFLIGCLLTISFTVHEIIAHEGGVYSAASNASGWLAPLEKIDEHYWATYQVSTPHTWLAAFVLLGACGLMVAILPLRININEFSLHHFYKNRLVRCYLGAGRANERRPNPFTGFDSKDDLRIAGLRAKPPDEWQELVKPYFGPYPIVNTTLNLNAGSELATQERKGASFIFSALHCGFDPPHSLKETRDANAYIKGYRDARHYMYASTGKYVGGPAIGTAMGISGAAANPDGGYHTSAPLAFLMTVFDVRLGWWVGNPKKDGPSSRPGPLYALGSLLSELFAQTDGYSRYLNLSDGGHFENLGLYELVKRRCRYIIVCDGEEDAELNFESLGGAIRKCRADFGVEIHLNPGLIHAEGKPSQAHCVMGTVTYPEVTDDENNLCGGTPEPPGGPAKGWIFYLKASLTGDEPEDVTQYHATHPVFPHEPTANQFFTESQFESYRRLGLHVVESAFESVREQLRALRQDRTHTNLSALFRGLCQRWHPPAID